MHGPARCKQKRTRRHETCPCVFGVCADSSACQMTPSNRAGSTTVPRAHTDARRSVKRAPYAWPSASCASRVPPTSIPGFAPPGFFPIAPDDRYRFTADRAGETGKTDRAKRERRRSTARSTAAINRPSSDSAFIAYRIAARGTRKRLCACAARISRIVSLSNAASG
jgi:hypothetical protein